MRRVRPIQLSELVDMYTPSAVLEEVKYNFINHYSMYEFMEVRAAFKDFNDLYEGKFPGYRACNTKFHDKIHTTDALLAVSRLIEGYNCRNPHKKLPSHEVKIALIATILHDTGYLQKSQDVKGTGAKYTLNHVDRSMEFIGKYLQKMHYSHRDIVTAQNMICCTDLGVQIPKIKFPTPTSRTLGLMLGTADMLGQMASRTYLERLLHLYREFKEGNVKGYASEYDLLKKTFGFHEIMKVRLAKVLKNVQCYVQDHFKKRYHINENMYESAVERQIEYLKSILNDKNDSYREKLRRIV